MHGRKPKPVPKQKPRHLPAPRLNRAHVPLLKPRCASWKKRSRTRKSGQKPRPKRACGPKPRHKPNPSASPPCKLKPKYACALLKQRWQRPERWHKLPPQPRPDQKHSWVPTAHPSSYRRNTSPRSPRRTWPNAYCYKFRRKQNRKPKHVPPPKHAPNRKSHAVRRRKRRVCSAKPNDKLRAKKPKPGRALNWLHWKKKSVKPATKHGPTNRWSARLAKKLRQ